MLTERRFGGGQLEPVRDIHVRSRLRLGELETAVTWVAAFACGWVIGYLASLG